MTLVTTTDVIGLSGWEAVKPPHFVEKNCNGQRVKVYQIEAALLTGLQACPRCGAVHPVFKKNGSKRQWVKHTPTHGLPTEIHFRRQRYKCQDCYEGKEMPYTFLQPLSGVDEGHRATFVFMEHLWRRAFPSGKNFLQIADEMGMSERMARNVFREHTERLKNVPEPAVSHCISIDECHLSTGEHAVLFDNVQRRVIDILPLKNKTLVERYLRQVPGWAGIRVVIIDMHEPYRSAVNTALPDAVIVNDRFHVTDMANRAANGVRVKLRKPLSRRDKRNVLPDRRLLYRRRRNLSDDDRLELERLAELGPQYSAIKQAYDLKEDFLELYNQRTTASAVRAYDCWATRFLYLPEIIRESFRELLTAMGNWKWEVFNFIEYRYSNGSVERINRMIKDLSRAGCSLATIRARMVNRTFRRSSPTHKDASGHTDKGGASRRASNTAGKMFEPARVVPHQPLLPIFQSDPLGDES